MGCEARKLHVKDGVTWRSRCYGEVNKYFRLGEYKAQLKPRADILSQDLQPRGELPGGCNQTRPVGQGVLPKPGRSSRGMDMCLQSSHIRIRNTYRPTLFPPTLRKPGPKGLALHCGGATVCLHLYYSRSRKSPRPNTEKAYCVVLSN